MKLVERERERLLVRETVWVTEKVEHPVEEEEKEEVPDWELDRVAD